MPDCIDCRKLSNNNHSDRCICNSENRCNRCSNCMWCIDYNDNGKCVPKNKYNIQNCKNYYQPPHPHPPHPLPPPPLPQTTTIIYKKNHIGGNFTYDDKNNNKYNYYNLLNIIIFILMLFILFIALHYKLN